ncbi:MAG: M6 family metalloprotease domain-containing protein [Chitinispirillales bacterium]|jgi:M6 family metalloprotease-like protein|nr:M6 family metalloprotease domain-containing protein [Chitinispirillales bacterium]
MRNDERNTAVSAVYLSILFILLALVSIFVPSVFAAPHDGDRFDLSQPDGSLVPVRVFGDEFYQDVESLDGYTLIRDSDGWICYAELNPDGSEYVSTGVRYTGGGRSGAGLRKGLRIGGASVLRKHRGNRDVLGYDELVAPRATQSLSKTAAVRRVVGLTILVEFPDQRSNITHSAMNDFCNRVGGVNGTNPAGSVRDYYYYVSNGLLEYVNIVTPFVRLDSNLTYYDRGSDYQYVPQFLTHTLNKLKASGFDISEVTTETAGSGNNRREVVLALNILYAGSPRQGWSNGLWPHSGTISGTPGAIAIGNVRFSKYQLSNLGTGNSPPTIGTFVHENGHLVMGWPDLYSYESPAHSNGVGKWCVMNSNDAANPQQPNAYLRALAGWIDVTMITDASSDVLGMPSNAPQVFKYARNAKESYYIEARRRTSVAVDSRNSAIPSSGLLIWHVHTDGKNTDPTKGFPLLSLVQADGRGDLERKANSGDAGDPFRARNKNAFNKTTVPAAVYYDGTLSNIDISEISDSGAAMTFKVGALSAGNPSSPTPTASVSAKQLSYDIKASPTGTITFTLPTASRVSLKAYNINGKLITTLVDGMKNRGTHNVHVGMGQGLYIVKMKSGGYSKEVKIRNVR